MTKRYHYAPATKDTHDEARLMDAQDDYSAHMVETTGRHSPSRLEDFAQGGRLQHFADGANYVERDAQGNDSVRNAINDAGGDPHKYVGTGIREPWYVTQRYGANNQIPFDGPRQSPLPYPKTYNDHVDDEYNERLDRSL